MRRVKWLQLTRQLAPKPRLTPLSKPSGDTRSKTIESDSQGNASRRSSSLHHCVNHTGVSRWGEILQRFYRSSTRQRQDENHKPAPGIDQHEQPRHEAEGKRTV